ncbi:hypothetical protein Pme01_59540 [Planosporangium mesophilum]|uniref:Uncharacterized protein n=1 Tax=Planosporangium mesophilum TaxID=689768 RepID=A0A8J3TIH5_9ACTN|nr:hypothetical protein Pme01_59540 [Planosporangium mesophilum]
MPPSTAAPAPPLTRKRNALCPNRAPTVRVSPPATEVARTPSPLESESEPVGGAVGVDAGIRAVCHLSSFIA